MTLKNIALKKARKNPAISQEDGFSLVELMVVIVIIGLLTSIVVVNVMPNKDQGMVTTAQVQIKQLSTALEAFRSENNRYPTMDEGLEILIKAPANTRFGRKNYIPSLPKDPWGSDYQYLIPGHHGAYDIFSKGADQALGGSGMDSDIGNWVVEDKE